MELAARPMETHEIDLMLDYFLGLDEPALRKMGVEPSKLPPRDEWHALLINDFDKRFDQRQFFYTTWTCDDEPIGHANINKLKYGESAFMHLHVWRPDLRRSGIGTTCLKSSIRLFFELFRLETIYCEPNAHNEPPVRTLPKVGFDFIKTYETMPGWINFHQPVSRHALPRAKVIERPKTRIETERLILREFELFDAAAVYAFGSNAEVNRYTADEPTPSINEAEDIIVNTWHREYRENGYGRLAMVDKSTDNVIGFCGLKYLDDMQAVDLGYRMLPEFWGRGLATEAAMATIQWSEQQFAFDELIGMTLPENVPSQRVLEKTGFAKTDTIAMPPLKEVYLYKRRSGKKPAGV